eukprot:400571_1
MPRLDTFNTQNLSNLAWGFAQMMPEAASTRRLFHALATTSMDKMDYFNERYLSNLSWSMAVIGSFPPDVFTSIFRRVNDQQTERLSAAEHAQYFTADLAFRLHAPAQAKACGLARGLRKKFAAAVAALYPATGGPLNDLQETLSRLGVAHQARVNSGHGYLLDVAVLPLDRRLVIELDGPTRFLHQNRRPTGWTVLKRRLLRLMGWTVIAILWWEWREQKTLNARMGFIKARMAPYFKPKGSPMRVSVVVTTAPPPPSITVPKGPAAQSSTAGDLSETTAT